MQQFQLRMDFLVGTTADQFLRTALNWRFGISCRSPRVDDRGAGCLKWGLVARSHTDVPGSSNLRNLGIGTRDRMTMPASARDDLWIGFGPIDVERYNALAEQGDDLFLERGGE